ncbi:Transcription factor IIIA [Frankliniella fusca]|uniref:Transcription factor IIIA n=1 Tax=Frankliniella fusca TaxID=407009 RepID=A0AAE1LL70_9NEOP|nr:Transcription factor IIIA [Frankliniella fusca]
MNCLSSSGARLLSSGVRTISCAWVVVNDTLIMSVYASPNAPPHLLQSLFDLTNQTPARWKLLMGDFNRNVRDPRTRTKMDQIANTANLTIHYNDATTTKAGTTIDLVLSNFPLKTGVYNSLTSFQKPLWVTGIMAAKKVAPLSPIKPDCPFEDCSKTESGDGLEMETTNRTDVLNFSSLMDDGLVESFLNASEMNDYPTDSTVDVPHQVLAGDRPEQKPSTSCSKPKPRVGGQDSSCTKQAVNKGGNRQPGAKKPTVQKKPADCVVGVPLWVYCRLRESAERNLATIEAELRERSRVVREARLALSHAKSRQHKVRVAYNGANQEGHNIRSGFDLKLSEAKYENFGSNGLVCIALPHLHFHSQSASQTTSEARVRTAMDFTCPYHPCEVRFETMESMNTHIRTDRARLYEVDFRCPVMDCGKTGLRSGAGTMHHLRQHHAELWQGGRVRRAQDEDVMFYDELGEEVEDPRERSECASDMFSRTADNVQLSAARFLLDLLHRLLEKDVPQNEQLNLFPDSGSIAENCKVTEGFLKKVYVLDGLVEPEEVDLSAEEAIKPWTKKGRPVFHTVSIERTLEHEDVFDEVLQDATSGANTVALTSYKDGQHCQSHPVFSLPVRIEGICIRVRMYSDEVELAKGLSPNCGTHKSYIVYVQVDNVHPRFHSWVDSVHLGLIARYPVVKSYGLKRVLQPLVEEMRKLATDGMNVRVKGKRYHFRVVCNMWMADSATAHPLCGLKAGFGGEKYNTDGLVINSYPCRFCEAPHAEIDNCNSEADCTRQNIALRTWERHRHQSERIQGGSSHKLYQGPNGILPVDCLPYFEPPLSCPPDGMHDIALRVIGDNMRRTLKFYSDTTQNVDGKDVPLLKYSTAMEALNSFKYGSVERANVPPLLGDDLLQAGQTIKGSASQRLTLFRIFSFAIGPLVLETAAWRLHLLLVRIVEIIWSLRVTTEMIEELEGLVAQYIRGYKRLYGNSEVFPKLHYLIHYGRMARLYGPWRLMMNWTNEHRHQYFKQIATNSKNFRNVSKTLSRRFQERRCHFLRGVEPILPPQWEALSKATSFEFCKLIAPIREGILSLIPDVGDQEFVTQYTSLKYEGTLIKRGAYNVLDLDNESMPVFFKALQVVVVRGQALVYGVRVPSKFQNFYHAYVIKVTHSADQRQVVRADRFLPAQTLNHHKPHGTNVNLLRVHYAPVFLS